MLFFPIWRMSECRYFINNIETESLPTSFCSKNLHMGQNASLSFGRYFNDSTTIPFSGKLYLLAVYSPIIDWANISSLFNAGLPNQPPSAFSSEITTPEDTPIVIELNATDPEGAPFLFNITTVPEFGHLEDPNSNQPISALDVISDPHIRYVPKQDFHGSVSFQYFVIEAQGSFIHPHPFELTHLH